VRNLPRTWMLAVGMCGTTESTILARSKTAAGLNPGIAITIGNQELDLSLGTQITAARIAGAPSLHTPAITPKQPSYWRPAAFRTKQKSTRASPPPLAPAIVAKSPRRPTAPPPLRSIHTASDATGSFVPTATANCRASDISCRDIYFFFSLSCPHADHARTLCA
jgi:hypothetical protein